MSDDERAFRRAICLNPADDTPRLVFADWLEERGIGDRAEFIRLQVELARSHGGTSGCEPCARLRLPAPPPPAQTGLALCPAGLALQNRARGLYDRRGADRLLGDEPFQWDVWTPRIDRGFVGGIAITLDDYFTFADQIFTRQPVVEVTLSSFDRVEWQAVNGVYTHTLEIGEVGLANLHMAERDVMGNIREASDMVTTLFPRLANFRINQQAFRPFRMTFQFVSSIPSVSAAAVAHGRRAAGLPPLAAK